MAYQQGSIGGVKFRTIKNTIQAGRRKGVYEIPFDDRGVVGVDIGRRPRRFQIDAILLGADQNDALAQRDKLLKVLEKKGPVLLVHPSLGPVNVEIEPDSEITEKTEAVNQIEISFTAREAREAAAQPGLGLGTKANVLKAAKDLGDSLGDAMETDISVDGVADFVASANIDVLDDVLQGIQDINSDIDAILSIPGNVASQIDAISRELAELLAAPRKLFDAIDGAIELIAAAIERITPEASQDPATSLTRAIASTLTLGQTAPPVAAVDTPARVQQRKNQGALILNIRTDMLRRLTQTAAGLEYGSANAAQGVARKLRAATDATLEAVIEGQELNPAVRRALVALRNAGQAHLKETAGALVALSDYRPPETLPAQVIAHVLYGDATRSDEIIARNPNVVHPGFIPGGIAIEVLAE